MNMSTMITPEDSKDQSSGNIYDIFKLGDDCKIKILEIIDDDEDMEEINGKPQSATIENEECQELFKILTDDTKISDQMAPINHVLEEPIIDLDEDVKQPLDEKVENVGKQLIDGKIDDDIDKGLNEVNKKIAWKLNDVNNYQAIDEMSNEVNEKWEELKVVNDKTLKTFYIKEGLFYCYGMCRDGKKCRCKEGQKFRKSSKRYVCHICDKVFFYRYSLRKHAPIHVRESNNFLLTCDECGKKYKTKTALKGHLDRHKNGKYFACKICEQSFYTSIQLDEHMTTVDHLAEKKFVCNICGKAFLNMSGLRLHKLYHNDKKIYTCDVCKKSFNVIRNLKNHLFIHIKGRPFACDVCEKKFRCPRVLYAHRKKKHYHTITPYVCDVCNKNFFCSTLLKKHKKIHTKSNFTCEICKKCYKSEYRFNRHRKTHLKPSEQ